MPLRLSMSIVGAAEADAVRRVITEDGYLGIGSETRLFEKEVAAYLGIAAKNAVSANTGTAALTLAVDALRPAVWHYPGKPRVLVPSLTFVASFQAILAAGCEPVPCDVLPETGTLDLADAGRRLTPDVFAVMPVHYASNPWDIDGVYDFARRHGLRVIEDAAHAFGCRHRGRKIGSFGDAVCFSFDGIKNITCGEGGLCVIFDDREARIAADARLLSVEGDTAARFSGVRTWDPDVKRIGWRFHMSNIMAAIGRVQLGRLESEFIPARRRLAGIYAERLAAVDGIALLRQSPDDFIVPHIQVARVLRGRKEALKAALAAREIPVGVHYKPNHLLRLFRPAADAPPFPATERLYGELVTLPLHPGLSDDDVHGVCDAIGEALK